MYSEGRYEEARAEFEACLREDPDDALARVNLGAAVHASALLREDLEGLAEARRHYQAAGEGALVDYNLSCLNLAASLLYMGGERTADLPRVSWGG